jgi:hypothetical protein
MEYLKIKGHDNLLRDPNTNSIVNTNMAEYQEYVMRKKSKNEENQKIQTLESDVASMKGDLDEIKNLLKRLVNESR